MGDSRRMLDYSDLWEGAAAGAKPAAGDGKGKSNGNGKSASPANGIGRGKANLDNNTHGSSAAQSSANGGHKGWSQDGTPQTASSARKVRRIMSLIGAGNIVQAEVELAKMGPAKNNYEITRALAMAKAGKRTMATAGPPGEDEGQEGDGELDQDYDMADDDDDYYEEDQYWEEGDEEAERMDAAFDWQGGMNGSSGKQLSHEEIWDDSALLDAWNAAEEEYKIFHARRAEHEKGGKGRAVLAQGDAAEPPKKRSALWYDSPAVGSAEAEAARAAAKEEQERSKMALEERKKQARALLEQVAGPSSTSVATYEGGDPLSASAATAEPAKRRKLKGVTPPSSSISGNLAWHSACATVSRTPNEIGDQRSNKTDATPTSHQEVRGGGVEDTAQAGQVNETATQGEEIFQNLAMAWYYAGYYQAMAVKWNAEQNGNG